MTGTSTPAYDHLHALNLRLHRLGHLAAIAGWDQAANMPPRGNEARAAAQAELAALTHDLRTAPDLAQVFADPQVQARGMQITMPHPQAGDIPLVASPLRLSDTPVTYRLAPPRLGQHTREVLAELLEIDEPTCDRLAADGVLG